MLFDNASIPQCLKRIWSAKILLEHDFSKIQIKNIFPNSQPELATAFGHSVCFLQLSRQVTVVSSVVSNCCSLSLHICDQLVY